MAASNVLQVAGLDKPSLFVFSEIILQNFLGGVWSVKGLKEVVLAVAHSAGISDKIKFEGIEVNEDMVDLLEVIEKVSMNTSNVSTSQARSAPLDNHTTGSSVEERRVKEKI